MKNPIPIILTILLLGNGVLAQEVTGTVRGTVIDKFSQQTIPGANIIMEGTDPVVGTTTDMNGNFKFENLPVGRITLRVSYIGYRELLLNGLEVTSGKELVLTIELEEEITKMNEVVIRAERDLSEPINELASVSATQFSVEESDRFAGAKGDVARMVQSFAGVATSNDANNDIVIRGNSPNGLLWRLEGVDIPNPNHFGQAGATGGPVSMLNNNVLMNSDFFSGAFPAEYGNALSGVFDLRMRNGNNRKHEFLFQIGFNGFEGAAEGPISKKSGASYLVDYRYSTLAVFNAMGIDFGTGTAVPQYQDLTFKFNFPTKKAGTFSFFGLGGISNIEFITSGKPAEESDDNLYSGREEDLRAKSRMGVAGLTHKKFWGKNVYSKIILSASYIQSVNDIDSVIADTREPFDWYNGDEANINYTGAFMVNYKHSKRHLFRIGGFATRLGYRIDETVYDSAFGGMRKIADANGHLYLLQPYATWQFRISDNLTLNTGMHFSYLSHNKDFKAEPRLGLVWQALPRHKFSAGYGYHTQAPRVNLVYREVYVNGEYVTPNTDLSFTTSQHFVVGYTFSATPLAFLKAELYYQMIDDAGVSARPSFFSTLNDASFNNYRPDSLVNGGTGTNYGLELTYSRTLDHGLYYMLTASVFKSTYEGSDGIERSTAFDGRYILNAVGGYEIELGKNKPGKIKRFLTFDSRFTWAGGNPYIPVDKDATIKYKVVLYDYDNAYSERLKDYLRLDLRIGFKMMYKKSTHEMALDIQNVTNRKNWYALNFDPNTGEDQVVYQLGFFPVFLYRVTF